MGKLSVIEVFCAVGNIFTSLIALAGSVLVFLFTLLVGAISLVIGLGVAIAFLLPVIIIGIFLFVL